MWSRRRHRASREQFSLIRENKQGISEIPCGSAALRAAQAQVFPRFCPKIPWSVGTGNLSGFLAMVQGFANSELLASAPAEPPHHANQIADVIIETLFRST
jgi:hypothetical protein